MRGEGCRLWDDEGNEYLDFLAGISVCNAGHCHPEVVEAVREQAARLMHATNLFYTEPGMRLAERLSRLLARRRACSSATPGRRPTRPRSSSRASARPAATWSWPRGAFHGRTFGALSATPQETKQAPFAPLVPGFRVVPRDDPGALDAAVDERTAAVLLEPIQGETGIWPLSDEMLRAAREACDRAGAAADLRRDPDAAWGARARCGPTSRPGCRPDVMTTAKALGGGMPIGALRDRAGAGRRARARRPRLDLRRRPGGGRGRRWRRWT